MRWMKRGFFCSVVVQMPENEKYFSFGGNVVVVLLLRHDPIEACVCVCGVSSDSGSSCIDALSTIVVVDCLCRYIVWHFTCAKKKKNVIEVDNKYHFLNLWCRNTTDCARVNAAMAALKAVIHRRRTHIQKMGDKEWIERNAWMRINNNNHCCEENGGRADGNVDAATFAFNRQQPISTSFVNSIIFHCVDWMRGKAMWADAMNIW